MKLNIYDHKKVVKTYETDTYDLLWGTVEDVAQAIDLDNLTGGTDIEIIKAVGKLVVTSKETVNNLLKDIFDGLTDEEIRHARVKDMARVMIDVVKYTMSQLDFGVTEKN